MTAISIPRIVVPSLVLVAACAAALFLGITHVRPQPPVEITATTAAPAVAPPGSGARNNSNNNEGPTAFAMALDEANALAAPPPASPRAPDTDESVPAFDVARVEPTGEAVIAGRAAPGATVELLLNGEHHDQAVADQSGQFVMVPPGIPPGNYELTLRSRQPDGKQVTSSQSVVVAIYDEPPATGAVRSRAEVPPAVAAAPVQAHQPSQPSLQIAKGQDMAVSRPPHAAAANPLSDGGAPSGVVVPKIATTVVSRGDSLWRISRVTYGVGTRYSVVYKANRRQIRNPDRIYPGQIFILPKE